jgi:exodeoxyribonuclease V
MSDGLFAVPPTREQAVALEKIGEWLEAYHDGHPISQIFRLYGIAGSGKTFTALQAALMRPNPAAVIAAAFTGKACHALKQRGFGPPDLLLPTTIHKLVAQPLGELQDTPLEERLVPVKAVAPVAKTKAGRDQPAFTPKQSVLASAEFIVIDEVSMVDEFLGTGLMSLGKPILVLGDPYQLPPIAGQGFFTHPRHGHDILLTEIVRQKAGSPVIMLAEEARLHRPVPYGVYGTSAIIDGTDLTIHDLVAADQVLCHTNVTRHFLNLKIRAALGFKEDWPQPGEKLMCLKNNARKKLLNGSQWRVISSELLQGERSGHQFVQVLVESLDAPHDTASTLCRIEPFLQPKVQHDQHLDQFTYGYCCTVHKAQGSEWPSVVLIDQSYIVQHQNPHNPTIPWQWLYTGITRAANRITIVRWFKNTYLH